MREREAGALVRARACLGGKCRALREQQHGSPPVWNAYFGMPRRPVVRSAVLVLERAGLPAAVVTRRVRLERWEENGPGCGTQWVGLVRYVDGKLVQVPYADRSRYARN